jgi:hypothetical protein
MVQTSDGQVGWVRNTPGQLSRVHDCSALPLSPFRPRTGILKSVGENRGPGVLEVRNHTTQDSVIIMTDVNGRTVTSSYIRAGDTFLMPNIPNGTYDVYHTSGMDWNGEVFETSMSRERFDEPFTFASSNASSDGWTIELQPRIDGNLDSDPVPGAAFPSPN